MVEMVSSPRSRQLTPGAGASALKCPRCGLVIGIRFPALAPERCPRCLVRQRVAVKLEEASVNTT